MNSDMELDEFIADLVDRVSRFREIVRTGWAEDSECSFEEWLRRMDAAQGMVYPGEKPILHKEDWDAKDD